MSKHSFLIKISTFILKLTLTFGIIWYLLLRNPNQILSCLKGFNTAAKSLDFLCREKPFVCQRTVQSGRTVALG